MKLGSFGAFMKKAGKNVSEFSSKNSHIISGGVALVGVVVTAVCAYKARPKVDHIMEEQREKMEELDECVELPEEEVKKVKREITTETVKKLVPALAPTVISAMGTSGAIVFSVASGVRKIAQATQLATASELAYKELYDKTKKVVGEEKVSEIKKELAQDKVDELSDFGKFSIDEAGFYETGLGNDPWFDSFSGMLFKCSEKAIREAILKCKEALVDGQPYFVMNELYSELHLPQVKAGKRYGFKIESLTNQKDLMKPNLGNAVRWGEGSVSVLDWWDEPIVVTDKLG